MSANISGLLQVIPLVGNDSDSHATPDPEPPQSDNEEDNDGLEAMSDAEIRKKTIKARQRMEQSGDQIDEIEGKYYELLKKGAETSDARRKVFAMKARILRLKGHFEEMKRTRALRDLLVYEFASGHREVKEMFEEELGDEDLMSGVDMDFGEIQSQMTEAVSKIQADIGSLNENVTEMSAAVSMDSMSTGTLPEEEHMDRIAEGTDPESIDIDLDADDNTVDVEAMIGGAAIDDVDF